MRDICLARIKPDLPLFGRSARRRRAKAPRSDSTDGGSKDRRCSQTFGDQSPGATQFCSGRDLDHHAIPPERSEALGDTPYALAVAARFETYWYRQHLEIDPADRASFDPWIDRQLGSSIETFLSDES